MFCWTDLYIITLWPPLCIVTVSGLKFTLYDKSIAPLLSFGFYLYRNFPSSLFKKFFSILLCFYLCHLWMFFCCGGSRGSRKLSSCMHKVWYWPRVMVTIAQHPWAGWATYGETRKWTPVPGISQAWVRRCVGEGGICPLPSCHTTSRTFRNNLAGFSVSPTWRNVTRKIRTSNSICLAIQMHPAYELPAVFSFIFNPVCP